MRKFRPLLGCKKNCAGGEMPFTVQRIERFRKNLGPEAADRKQDTIH